MVLDPVRPFIPVLAGDDIGMSVAIDIRDGAGFEGARVDHVARERDLGGTGRSPRCEPAASNSGDGRRRV